MLDRSEYLINVSKASTSKLFQSSRNLKFKEKTKLLLPG